MPLNLAKHQVLELATAAAGSVSILAKMKDLRSIPAGHRSNASATASHPASHSQPPGHAIKFTPPAADRNAGG